MDELLNDLKKHNKDLKKLIKRIQKIAPEPVPPLMEPYTLVLSNGKRFQVQDLDVLTVAVGSKWRGDDGDPRVSTATVEFTAYGEHQQFMNAEYAFVIKDEVIHYEGRVMRVKVGPVDPGSPKKLITLSFYPLARMPRTVA